MVSIKLSEFTETVREYAYGHLVSAEDREALCRMMKGLYKMAEQYTEKSMPDEEKALIACSRGCSFCCRVNVPVLYPEAVLIASHLFSTLHPSVLGRMIGQMEGFVRSVAGYDEEERIAANIPCVFLGRLQECTIHDVRPFACRAVISADSSACREAMRIALLDDMVLVPMNIRHKSINDSAFLGLADAMKGRGYKDSSSELVSAVLKILRSFQ